VILTVDLGSQVVDIASFRFYGFGDAPLPSLDGRFPVSVIEA
jgi:hypothetical protein